MLQPRTYPELIGKALVLEADPFVTMVDDDNPWAEGLFMVISLGVIIGIVRLIGGLFLTASLPPADAVYAALLQGWRQLSPFITPANANSAVTDQTIQQIWRLLTETAGYTGGWSRLLVVLLVPLGFLVQWLFYGVISHVVAMALGGEGTLNRTMGATALMVAPQILRFLDIIPFVSISWLLLAIWGVLITYRAVEVAHALPWRRAVVAALVAPVLFLGLAFGVAALISIFLGLGGIA